MSEIDERARFEARVGTTLGGKWKLNRLIGIGGMAAVYAASHRNGAEAAIKILHAQHARRADARNRFLREAYIANKAGKGAVAVLDDDVDEDGAPYLVMDLLHGEPVDSRAQARGGKLPTRDVLWIASQVLATLEHAHAHGIIHRDLKPDNLFWTTEPSIKVLDFGVARLRDANTTETTRTGTVVGTPTFMAPEQALGVVTDIDGRTDLWSLGAIMFRLLTGRHVHPVSGSNALVVAATKRAPSLAQVDPNVPPFLAAIVDTALQYERADRYPNARAMREAVEKVVLAEGDRQSAPSLPKLEQAAPALAPPADEPGFATGMSHVDSVALHNLLKLIGDAVALRMQDGPQHVSTQRKVDAAYRAAATALENAHIGLFWNVVPEGFVAREQLVWMPKPPLQRTPEKMHADGVRMLGLLPGLEKADFDEVVRLIAGDLAPFSDFATFLHTRQLKNVVHRIDAVRPGVPQPKSVTVEPSDDRAIETMLAGLEESDDGAVRVTLLERLERWGAGHEAEIARALLGAGVDIGMGLLRVLSVLGTDAAKAALEGVAREARPLIRLVAISYLDAGQRLETELGKLFLGDDAVARLDALGGIERYKLAALAPALERHARAASFDRLAVEDRRQALSALGAVARERAEAVAIDLVGARGRQTQTRQVAAELLGSIGESRQARAALQATERDRDESLWDVACVALAAFDARVKS